jgi:hypothetical protein
MRRLISTALIRLLPFGLHTISDGTSHTLLFDKTVGLSKGRQNADCSVAICGSGSVELIFKRPDFWNQ